MVNKKAEMKIQQMTFMIIFVFIFFAFAGLFFVKIQTGNLTSTHDSLAKEATISSLETIMNMPELNCESGKSLCIDEDKLYVLASISDAYSELWPVASIEVRKVYPKISQEITCPAANCTTYKIYRSSQESIQVYGTLVSLCKKVRRDGLVQDDCTIARLSVGVKD